MAIRTPPSWISGQIHTAENDRLTTAGFISTPGVRQSAVVFPQAITSNNFIGDLAVVPASPAAATVVVRSGWGYVKGTVSGVQGTYGVYNDDDVTLTIAANSSGSPRTDLIYIKVTDVNYGDPTSTAQILVQAGSTTVPASSIPLAHVTVASGFTSVVVANIADKRVAYRTNAAVNPLYPVNAQSGTSYTLALSDQDGLVSFSSTSAVTVTVPDDVFPVGATINIFKSGASGDVNVSASTLRYSLGSKLRAQWSMATLIQIDVNVWLLTGDCKA